jgi:hypothetical protein
MPPIGIEFRNLGRFTEKVNLPPTEKASNEKD